MNRETELKVNRLRGRDKKYKEKKEGEFREIFWSKG